MDDIFLNAFKDPIPYSPFQYISAIQAFMPGDPVLPLSLNFQPGEIDNKSSILSIDLYLQLEKKREERNEKVLKCMEIDLQKGQLDPFQIQ